MPAYAATASGQVTIGGEAELLGLRSTSGGVIVLGDSQAQLIQTRVPMGAYATLLGTAAVSSPAAGMVSCSVDANLAAPAASSITISEASEIFISASLPAVDGGISTGTVIIGASLPGVDAAINVLGANSATVDGSLPAVAASFTTAVGRVLNIAAELPAASAAIDPGVGQLIHVEAALPSPAAAITATVSTYVSLVGQMPTVNCDLRAARSSGPITIGAQVPIPKAELRSYA